MINYSHNEQQYKLFASRDIIDILIGSSETGEEIINNRKFDLNMPYLSGSKIQALSSTFGFVSENTGSRWLQFQQLVDYCVTNKKCRALINYMFQKQNFMNMWDHISVYEADVLYEKTLAYILEKINLKLHFSGYKLKQNGSSFDLLKENQQTIEIPTVKINTIDREYVVQKITQAKVDITNSNYDSALTKARTVLEEVLIYMLEKKGIQLTAKGDLNKLFAAVRDSYNMNTNPNLDKNINELINGLNKIVSAIGNLRNQGGDSHGLGRGRYNISDYHAVLVVNSSVAICEFLISVMERNLRNW